MGIHILFLLFVCVVKNSSLEDFHAITRTPFFMVALETSLMKTKVIQGKKPPFL